MSVLVPLAVCAAVGVLVVVLLSFRGSRRATTEELLTESTLSLQRGEFDKAWKLAHRAHVRSPGSTRAKSLAGQAAGRLGLYDDALGYFEQAPDDGSYESIQCCLQGAKLALTIGRAADAEQFAKRVLQQNPDHTDGNKLLAYLLGVEGRSFEAAPHMMRMVRQGQATVDHLMLLGVAEPVIVDRTLVIKCCNIVPDDPVPMLGMARSALVRNDIKTAETILREVVAAAPDIIEGQARLGTILFAASSHEFYRWHAELPASADGHPEIWVLRGLWAKREGQEQAAIRCFWEAVRLDSEHRVANYQLGQMLLGNGETENASLFLRRAEDLRKLRRVLDRVYVNPTSTELMREAAALTESLVRLSR